MHIVPRRTICPLTELENWDATITKEKEAFDIICKKRYGDKLSVGKKPHQPVVPDEETGEFVPYEDGETPPYQMPVQKATDSSGKFINLGNILDNYINMEVCFPQGESKIWGKVIGLCLDKDGKVIGSPNENPYMNTALYEVQFDDGWLFFFLNFSVS